MEQPPTAADIWSLLTDDDARDLAERAVRAVSDHATRLPADAYEQE